MKNAQILSEFQRQFSSYMANYTPYSHTDAELFFETIKDKIPTVDACFMNLCEAEIRMK